ncbi:MAG TPA: MFS transporter [Galbitalea sp.]
MSTAGEDRERAGILSAPYLSSTVGTFALVFLSAFENLAVTTVMPGISAELHGTRLYALAFAAPLAAAIVGMVVAGNWSDRRGPGPVLYASAALFVVGLIVAGTAVDMWMIVLGRLIYGLAGGAVTVAIYVIVARLYPAALQPKIFGAYAAAWVVPSLVGPYLAALVAQYVGWHWVFLGVVILVVPAVTIMLPALRRIPVQSEPHAVPWSVARICWAVLVALAVLGLDLSSELAGWIQIAGALIAFAVALVALRTLLPAGTLRAARGLPGVISTRGLIAGAYFGAEVYVPYLLINHYGLTAAGAGLALTGAGVVWAFASWAQGRRPDERFHGLFVRVGATTVAAAIAILLGITIARLPAWSIMAAWGLASAGMGLSYPRLSVLTLQYSTPSEQGFNSSAMSIADSGGASLSLAITGIIFAGLGVLGTTTAIIGCFGLVFVFSLVAVGTSIRTTLARVPD